MSATAADTGWDPTPGIVSVWADGDGRATLWRRDPEPASSFARTCGSGRGCCWIDSTICVTWTRCSSSKQEFKEIMR